VRHYTQYYCYYYNCPFNRLKSLLQWKPWEVDIFGIDPDDEEPDVWRPERLALGPDLAAVARGGAGSRARAG
jgi:hypothetical protein